MKTLNKAMVLAAGKGTRLGTLGQTTPKCLIKAGGKPLLELLLCELERLNLSDVVINLHHLPAQVREFASGRATRTPRISLSDETEELLDTGGAIGFARSHFSAEEAFLVHNADIYTENVLQHFIKQYELERPDVALLIFPTDDPRGLLFDDNQQLIGWENRVTGEKRALRESDHTFFGFGGISILTPAAFSYMPAPGVRFSLIDTLLAMAEDSRRVVGYQMAPGGYWLDVGTQEKLALLNQRLAERADHQKAQSAPENS